MFDRSFASSVSCQRSASRVARSMPVGSHHRHTSGDSAPSTGFVRMNTIEPPAPIDRWTIRFLPYRPRYQGSACTVVVANSSKTTKAARTAASLPRCGAVLDLDGLLDQTDELLAVLAIARGVLRHVADRRERPVLGILAAAQDVGERGGGECEPEVGRRVRERRCRTTDHRERCFRRLRALRRLVTDADRADRRVGLLALRGQLDLVERRDLMTRADLTG